MRGSPLEISGKSVILTLKSPNHRKFRVGTLSSEFLGFSQFLNFWTKIRSEEQMTRKVNILSEGELSKLTIPFLDHLELWFEVFLFETTIVIVKFRKDFNLFFISVQQYSTFVFSFIFSKIVQKISYFILFVHSLVKLFCLISTIFIQFCCLE